MGQGCSSFKKCCGLTEEQSHGIDSQDINVSLEDSNVKIAQWSIDLEKDVALLIKFLSAVQYIYILEGSNKNKDLINNIGTAISILNETQLINTETKSSLVKHLVDGNFNSTLPTNIQNISNFLPTMQTLNAAIKGKVLSLQTVKTLPHNLTIDSLQAIDVVLVKLSTMHQAHSPFHPMHKKHSASNTNAVWIQSTDSSNVNNTLETINEDYNMTTGAVDKKSRI